MKAPDSLQSIHGMDIYLIDQIMKGRYQKGDKVLDAGAGGGRNLNWFLSEGFEMWACDNEKEREEIIKARFPEGKVHWETADIAALPYPDANFDHVICNAVLHFALDEAHFEKMFSELSRVMKQGASLFIRACGIMGIEDNVKSLGNGRYALPDGSECFLLNREMVERLMKTHVLAHIEAVKSVNVDDLRVMSTLVMVKL